MNAEDKRKSELDKIKQQKDAAANVVRAKLDALYSKEPDAGEELAKIKDLKIQATKSSAKSNVVKPDPKPPKLSKHQKYMEELSRSGRSLAEIQKAWHEYYQKLPDKEKHEVWQEFYTAHARRRQNHHKKEVTHIQQKVEQERKDREEENKAYKPHGSPKTQRPSKKQKVLENVAERARRSQKNPHKHALLFGLGMGTLFVFIILFSFFNERFITPFIRPNQNVSATSIIIDPSQTGNIGPEPKIIIPKINVEAPVVYDIKSVDEDSIQEGLKRGVVHYSITPNPGEKGNAVIVGHSSSNILNSGKYKFAFIFLRSLEKGDKFYLQKDGKRYVYKVFNKYVTSPKDLSVFDPTDRPATATLITCDPPGLSVNRLIIQGEQIYPDPAKNKQSSVDISNQQKPEELGGNSISLWQRIKNWF
ncbi:MAG TPA: sortase [Candidatus Saccharimonadales bacterium]|nr:sortase [Candidatus Saccharimonadales bacterium]